MAGARLERQAVLHHRLDRVALERAREFLRLRFHALDHGHRHHVFGHLRIQIENAEHLFHGFFMRPVRGVSLLPEELGRPQEHTRPQLPADDVRPLV